MPAPLNIFHYTAVDATGRRRRGTETSVNPSVLGRALEERGLVVIDITVGEQPVSNSGGFGHGRRRAVLDATRSISALLGAGLPVTRALAISDKVVVGEAAATLREVRSAVEKGESLAEALRRHPKLFSPLYVGMVRAGERSGDLAGAFARLTEQLEREQEIRSRLLSALIYPFLLATVGGAAVVLLLVLVLPRFVEMLQDSGGALPRSTALLLALSTQIREHWTLLLGLLVAVAVLLPAVRGSERGRRAEAFVLLQIPLIRSLRRQTLAARFARVLGVLLGGGAPLLTALQDTTESLDDPLARDEASRIRMRVREGASLHAAVTEGGFFPEVLTQLVAVGEEAGRTRDFLLKAATILEEGVDRTLRRLVTLAEPAMIVVFGGIVAFVALSLLQAIYGINADSFR